MLNKYLMAYVCSVKRNSSRLKVFVDGRDIGHDLLPVRPLQLDHVLDILEKKNNLKISIAQ